MISFTQICPIDLVLVYKINSLFASVNPTSGIKVLHNSLKDLGHLNSLPFGFGLDVHIITWSQSMLSTCFAQQPRVLSHHPINVAHVAWIEWHLICGGVLMEDSSFDIIVVEVHIFHMLLVVYICLLSTISTNVLWYVLIFSSLWAKSRL